MILNTLELPFAPGSSWDGLAWKAKRPSDRLDYAVDAAKWLSQSGRRLLDVDLFVQPGTLAVLGRSVLGPVGGNSPTMITVQLAGGVPGSRPRVGFMLTLDAGRLLTFEVELPIGAELFAGAAPVVSADALVIGGQVITVDGRPITI